MRSETKQWVTTAPVRAEPDLRDQIGLLLDLCLLNAAGAHVQGTSATKASGGKSKAAPKAVPKVPVPEVEPAMPVVTSQPSAE